MTLRANPFDIGRDYGYFHLILTNDKAKNELEPRKDVVAFTDWSEKSVVSKGVRIMMFFVNIQSTKYYLNESQYSTIDHFNSALFISTLETNYDFIW